MSLEHLDVTLTPDEARSRLVGLGISESAIPLLAKNGGIIAHELKALALISLGDEPANLKQLYTQVRQEDYHEGRF